MKVMLYIPVYHEYPESLESVYNLVVPECVTHLAVVRDDHQPEADDAYDRVTTKYSRARTQFLAGPYDALLTVEDDVIIPPHALKRLLETRADVAYGLYVSRRDYKWLAYYQVGEQGGYSLSDDPRRFRDVWGRRIVVEGVGLGCTFIRRRVLEQIAFRRDGSASCDWYLAVDCKRLGFVQICDTTVICGHITHQKAGKVVIWPDLDESDGYRLQPF